jgi:hypothetical protein
VTVPARFLDVCGLNRHAVAAHHRGMTHHPLFDFEPGERARLRTLSPTLAIVTAAASRDGVLTHRQLRALGVSDSAITRRIDDGRLHVRHRGVYAVGRMDLTRRGRSRAALLRYGRSAALSHRAAAAEHDLIASRGRVDVTVTSRPDRPPRSRGVDLHYTRRWGPGDVVWVHGLPCTSVERTLADLAGGPRNRDFVRAWNTADQRLLADVSQLGRQLARRRRGWRTLRSRLERADAVPPTESELELLFLELCRTYGLPAPVCQWPLITEDRSGRVDFVWPDLGVAVEVDSRRWHAIQDAYERDREKDLALRQAGFDPHRYTYAQVQRKAPQVAAAVRAALARGGVRAHPGP